MFCELLFVIVDFFVMAFYLKTVKNTAFKIVDFSHSASTTGGLKN
jgi:hypothetical protein